VRKSSAFLLAVSALAIISSPALAQGGQHMMGNNGQGMMSGDDHTQHMMGINGQGMMGGDDHAQHMMGNNQGTKGQDSQ
jgi:hypothetical protein